MRNAASGFGEVGTAWESCLEDDGFGGGSYENFLSLPFSTSPFPLLTKEGDLEDGFPINNVGNDQEGMDSR